MLSWKDAYSVGDETLDLQHKEIINYVNIVDEMSYTKDIDFSKILDDVERKAIKHFETEELYMEKIDFPKINNHKDQHKEILIVLDYFRKDLQRAHTEDAFYKITAKISSFLKDLVITHVLGDDQEYHIWEKSKK